jgi:transcriptional antiterminator RfaH
MGDIMDNWYLACHKTGKHNAFKVQMFLSEMGITVFIPQVCYRQPRLDRPGHFRKVLEPLFPGYLFIYFDHETHHTSKVAFSPGMSHFVRYGGTINPLHDTIVDEIMRFTLAVDFDGVLYNKKDTNKNKPYHGNKSFLTELQHHKIKMIAQETNGETRSVLFYAFIEAMREDKVS